MPKIKAFINPERIIARYADYLGGLKMKVKKDKKIRLAIRVENHNDKITVLLNPKKIRTEEQLNEKLESCLGWLRG